jgi:heme oxygenase
MPGTDARHMPPSSSINQPSDVSSPRPPLTTLLRDSTKDLHTRVERHPTQAALLRGGATIEAYARYLSQWMHAQRALEEHCRDCAAKGDGIIAAVWREYHARASHAEADLIALAHSPTPPQPATQSLRRAIAQAASESPATLLGIFYVFEGSTNGGPFIATALRRVMPLPPSAATSFLAPHGEAQHARWAQCKGDIDALALSDAERARALAGAVLAFESLERVFAELAA